MKFEIELNDQEVQALMKILDRESIGPTAWLKGAVETMITGITSCEETEPVVRFGQAVINGLKEGTVQIKALR